MACRVISRSTTSAVGTRRTSSSLCLASHAFCQGANGQLSLSSSSDEREAAASFPAILVFVLQHPRHSFPTYNHRDSGWESYAQLIMSPALAISCVGLRGSFLMAMHRANRDRGSLRSHEMLVRFLSARTCSWSLWRFCLSCHSAVVCSNTRAPELKWKV